MFPILINDCHTLRFLSMVENESNTCSIRKIILTSPKPFPEAYFHNQPEEHVLHSANSFLKSLCPKKIGHWRKISDDHKSGYYQGTGYYNWGGRKGGANTAIPHMVAREYRNTASKFSQILKPQLQVGKSWRCQYYKSSFQIEIILLCQCFEVKHAINIRSSHSFNFVHYMYTFT